MSVKSIILIVSAAWLAMGVGVRVASADGGTLHFSERRNDHLISVFTDPTPLRVGPVDVSVLVQDADSGTPTTNATIKVSAYPILHREHETSVPASVQAATNKLLQAAQLEFTESGWWHVEVQVAGWNPEPPIGFDVEVVEPLPHWMQLSPWIVWPVVPIGLFAFHQRLAHRRRNSPVRRAG